MQHECAGERLQRSSTWEPPLRIGIVTTNEREPKALRVTFTDLSGIISDITSLCTVDPHTGAVQLPHLPDGTVHMEGNPMLSYTYSGVSIHTDLSRKSKEPWYRKFVPGRNRF